MPVVSLEAMVIPLLFGSMCTLHDQHPVHGLKDICQPKDQLSTALERFSKWRCKPDLCSSSKACLNQVTCSVKCTFVLAPEGRNSTVDSEVDNFSPEGILHTECQTTRDPASRYTTRSSKLHIGEPSAARTELCSSAPASYFTSLSKTTELPSGKGCICLCFSTQVEKTLSVTAAIVCSALMVAKHTRGFFGGGPPSACLPESLLYSSTNSWPSPFGTLLATADLRSSGKGETRDQACP
mmetsp:Transcript_45757/g.83813  ORF Transcript_45757/g.83813 Transcript_45757/m.83813 type:complete len:239 (+) Transcript_45757:142-858(+)